MTDQQGKDDDAYRAQAQAQTQPPRPQVEENAEDAADKAGEDGKQEGASKVIYAAVLANIGIAVAKFVVAAITGSAAMLAEGIHSAVDTGNEFLLMIGQHQAAKPADPKHPFGYGKELYFWALLVALSVFSLGGGLSIYHGVSAIRHPEPVEDVGWSYLVLVVSAMFEGYSWNVSRKELNKHRKPGTSLWQAMRASKDATVFTVFIEDSAALVGLAIAAAGITLGWLTDNPYCDPAASILIGVLLVGAAFTLARETGNLLVGEGISPEAARRVRKIFQDDPAVERVDRLLSMQLGPDEVLLTAAVQFNRGMRIDEVETAIERLKKMITDVFPTIRHIYFESGALHATMP